MPKSNKIKKVKILDFYSSVSSTVISGRAFKVKNGVPIHPPQKDAVLVVDKPLPHYTPLLKDVKTVVCEDGGILNHFAIVCRELGIPFLVSKEAAKMIEDGEWVELSIELPAKKPKIAEDWIKIMSYIPAPPAPHIQNFHRKITMELPSFVNKNYLLDAKILPSGIYLSKRSFEKFTQEVCRNIPTLYNNLGKYDEMSDKKKFSAAVLAAVIAEPLFDLLITLTKEKNTALSLIKGAPALYMMLEGQEAYLKRFGITDAKIEIPEELKKKLRAEASHIKEESEKILLQFENKDEIITLANTIRALVRAYEEKNKLKIDG